MNAPISAGSACRMMPFDRKPYEPKKARTYSWQAGELDVPQATALA